jgi:hypothetical protein
VEKVVSIPPPFPVQEDPERLKIASAIERASLPDIFTTPIPPDPGGVAIAAMVE